MVLLAFSLQDQVDKFGAYVGIAAFFGLALLSLLYFAQAREVKRLREWAGRAPERAAELELAVAEHAEEVLRGPAAAPQPQPQLVAEPQPMAANGAVTLKPEEVAALAFARAAGVHEPHEPKSHPAPAVALAAAPVATAAPPAAPPVPAGGSNGAPPAPPPVTPAARQAEAPTPAPAPAPEPRRAEPPPPPLAPRRPPRPAARRPTPPPRRESNVTAVVVTAIIGVLVLAGAAFGVTRLVGSGDDEPTAPNAVKTPTEEVEETATAAPEATPTKESALVAVYNGTGVTGLAAQVRSQLVEEGYPEGNLGADTAPPEQQRQTSVVMYKRGSKPVAEGVATALDIRDIQQIDEPTQALIANAPKDWNVVVVVGADKSP
jgi:hypothetical protein